MNLGKVVASGTHAELIENSEYYQELIKHQDLK
jgi:ABC-type multidrug transport system fused ATPase/permease subunit